MVIVASSVHAQEMILSPCPLPPLEVNGLVSSPVATRDVHSLICKIWEWMTYLPGSQGENNRLHFPEAQC